MTVMPAPYINPRTESKGFQSGHLLDGCTDGSNLGSAMVGRSEAAVVGKRVGSPFDGAVVGRLVAPNYVGSILTVGKLVGAFERRNVGLDVVCDGVGLGKSARASDDAGVGFTGAALRASDGADVVEKFGSSVVGASLGKEASLWEPQKAAGLAMPMVWRWG